MNTTNNNDEPSMARQLHVLACTILGLDDEDHEDDELAAPLEAAIHRYAQKMVVAELKQLEHYKIEISPIVGLEVVNYWSIINRITTLEKELENESI